MRAVVKVKHSQGRAPSNAARYIAESKRDPEREGDNARPLFTNRGDDDLKYGDANRYLNDGPGRPAKGDLIHFSVSFREEDFERLGATDAKREAGLREAAREAMDELRCDLHVRDWRWVAAIHLNTPHPHIHFLISKQITDERGKERRLGKIPKRLLPHMERGPGDAARPVEGKLGEHFVAAVDRALERAREADRKSQEPRARTTTERLEEGPGANRESATSPTQVLAEPDLREAPVTSQTSAQTYAIKVVNIKHFKVTGTDNEVYIGRPMPGIKGSVLGNPYRIGRDGTREEVIEMYRLELQWKIIERGEEYRELQRLAEIARREELILVCWCAPDRCHGEVIKSEIESSNRLQSQEREALDMDQLLSLSNEFDTPLVHQDIEYRTPYNYYLAMKTAEGDLEMRRKIAAASPDEARKLQVRSRPDWPEQRLQVLRMALEHKFTPGTSWYGRLQSTGDREITDGSMGNIVGRILMDIREESKHRAPPIFLDRLNDETRAKVIPASDKSVEAGISRQGILNTIEDQVSRRDLPAAERDRISDYLVDKLFKLAGRNPSLGGRELTRELIIGRTESPNPASNIRQALASKSIDDTDYRTQTEHADWLGKHSQNIRELYERGAEIKDNVLVIPAEEHEVPGERDGIRVIDISYAHKKFKNNPRLAAEFHRLCLTIAGETADIDTEIKIFKHYYDQIEKDEAGRPLDKRDKDFKEKRAAALERTLEEMRVLAGGMAREETKESADVARSIADLSYAYRRIPDWKDAEHFHELGERLAGHEADLPTRVNIFNYYYSRLERDEEGHVLSPDDVTGRAAALERTLAEMWLAVEKQEAPVITPNDPEYVALLDRAAVDPEIMPETGPNAPANVPLVHTFTSFEEMGEWYHRREAEREAEEEYPPPEQGTEYEVDEYDAEELDSPEHEYTFDDAYSGRQADAAAWSYNTAARKAYLGGEDLRFPEEWGHEKKERIVETTLPGIDRRIENGDPLYNTKDETGKVVARGIISDINRLIYPDREKVLTRTASLAGWSGDQAKPGTLTYDELIEARSTLLELSLQERSSLESKRDLRESYQDLTERRAREPLMAQTFRHLSQVEGLIETLTSGRPQPAAGRERGRDSDLYVSLSGEKDALRLPVSNIRVYEAIRQLTEGAKLDLYTWKSKDDPAIIKGFTELEYDDRKKEASFLKGYVHERLRDPETRLIHGNEVFREAHKSLALARTPEEVNRAADAIRNSDQFDERERKLLFFGRAPDHYGPKMCTLRRMWWLPQKDMVKALSEGRLAPSPELRELIAELSSRRSEGRVDYYYSALKNPPEKMRKPEESVRLGLWPKSQGLLSYEKAYLLEETWKMKQSFAGRQSSLRETAPQLGGSPRTGSNASRKFESLRIYQAEFSHMLSRAVESRGFVSPEEMNVIRGKAWARLELPESPADPPTDAARQLNERIAELRERVQPQELEAAQALSRFIQVRTGSDYPSDRIPQEKLNKLESADLQRLEELKKDAAAKQEELSKGFEMIDQLRQEIAQARSNKEVERTSSIAAQTGVRAATANRSAPAYAQRIDSYREYTNHVAEIERGLIAEETRQKAGVEMEGNRNAQPDGLLTREEKLRIRVTAASLAWERIEPREVPANDPAEKQLLALSEAIKQLRDAAQSQARQAAVKLDEFIRSRNLDQFARQKTDYYYRADQIPRAEIQKLSPGDKREFAALERHAAATFREFKNGFSAIDSLRLEIENTRNGAGDPHTLNGNGHPERRDSANGGGASQHPPGKDPIPDPDRGRMNDRIILGKAIIAHARADAAASDYERARDHGHTFRFNIHDESLNGRRRISDLDVNRRADARGNRAADERGAERYDDRRSIHGQVSEADLDYHSTTLEQHGKRLDRLVKELEDKANVSGDSYRHARQRAEEVVEKYQNRGEQLPVPFIERETLVRTQDEAIKHGFAGHTERLERLRETLAEEHGQPARSDKEAARLAAQLFTARTEMKAQEERAKRFDETRHLRRWEIGGEKFSLTDIDRRLERATNEIHIFPGDRRQAKAEIERLNGTRAEVTRVIGEHQTELRGNVAEAGKLLDTLTRAYDRETALREQAGLVMPAPQFTRRELDRAADNIESTRDAAALRELSEYERRFNTYADQKERFTSQEGWGRAPGRALMAVIIHRESYERLAAFEQRGEIQPLLVETSDDRILTQKLQDTRPQSPIEWLVRPLIETPSEREIRQGTQAAFAQHEINLRAEFEKTRFYQEAAMGIAVEHATERNTLAGRDSLAPEVALTPKQAMTLEIYAERQANPEVRDQLLSLARGSTQSHFDAHSQARSAEPSPAREAAPDPGRGR